MSAPVHADGHWRNSAHAEHLVYVSRNASRSTRRRSRFPT